MRVRMGLWASPSKTDSLELGMMSPRKRDPDTGTNTALSPEFKREAVDLYRSSGSSIRFNSASFTMSEITHKS